jgi:hypothetical protein
MSGIRFQSFAYSLLPPFRLGKKPSFSCFWPHFSHSPLLLSSPSSQLTFFFCFFSSVISFLLHFLFYAAHLSSSFVSFLFHLLVLLPPSRVWKRRNKADRTPVVGTCHERWITAVLWAERLSPITRFTLTPANLFGPTHPLTLYQILLFWGRKTYPHVLQRLEIWRSLPLREEHGILDCNTM